MAYHRNRDGYTNGLVTTPVGICDISTEKRDDINPEGIEGGKTSGGLLSKTKSAGLAVSSTCSSSGGKGLLNEIRLQWKSAIDNGPKIPRNIQRRQ